MSNAAGHDFDAPNPEMIALHVMREMTSAQADGRRITALDLAESLQVRRADIRGVVSELHRQGLVDAMRMRVTLAGFAYARAKVAAPLRKQAVSLRLARAA